MTPEQFDLYRRVEQKHWWFSARRRILLDVMSHILPPSPQSLVVDVGCGTGGNLSEFSAHYSCIGIDASDDAISNARLAYPNLNLIRGRFPDELGIDPRRIDLLICTDVIEHVEDDISFVRMLCDALRPGAHLLLTVPADMSLWSQHDDTNHHFRRYDVQQFKKTWEGLPLDLRLLTYFNSRLYPIVKVARWLSRRTGRAFGGANTDFSIPPRAVNALLQRIFRGERRHLVAGLDRQNGLAYKRGVSLIALLRRRD